MYWPMERLGSSRRQNGMPEAEQAEQAGEAGEEGEEGEKGKEGEEEGRAPRDASPSFHTHNVIERAAWLAESDVPSTSESWSETDMFTACYT